MEKPEPKLHEKMAAARKRLGVSRRVMATLLGLGPAGASRVKDWEDGLGNVPLKVSNALERLPDKIPYRQKTGKKAFKFIDLFAGIGGIRLPFQESGGKCVFTSEWDKHSQITYAANFGEVPEKNGDIAQFPAANIPDHDLLLAGFPCQAFSQAGLKQGFLDTRGTMFFEIQRILAEKKPKAFLLENVKQLKGHDGGQTLETILAILRGENFADVPDDIPMTADAKASLQEELRYDVDFKVLKARDFGVPQVRERIYIVGFLREEGSTPDHKRVQRMFERVSEKYQAHRPLADILVDDPDITETVTISDRLWQGHRDRKERHKKAGKGFGYSLFTRDSDYCSTISARYYKDGSEILIDQSDLGRNPRMLLPSEARSLQGFPEDFVIDLVANAQAYKQFGNSVAVPVIRAIAREMLSEAGFDQRKS